jgi:hypothetical protein
MVENLVFALILTCSLEVWAIKCCITSQLRKKTVVGKGRQPCLYELTFYIINLETQWHDSFYRFAFFLVILLYL